MTEKTCRVLLTVTEMIILQTTGAMILHIIVNHKVKNVKLTFSPPMGYSSKKINSKLRANNNKMPSTNNIHDNFSKASNNSRKVILLMNFRLGKPNSLPWPLKVGSSWMSLQKVNNLVIVMVSLHIERKASITMHMKVRICIKKIFRV